MSRRSILKIMKEIIKLLSREKELTVRQLARRTRSGWGTTLKGLEFLRDIGHVKERRDTSTKRGDRLFSLVK